MEYGDGRMDTSTSNITLIAPVGTDGKFDRTTVKHESQ